VIEYAYKKLKKMKRWDRRWSKVKGETCDNVAQGCLKSLEFPEKYLDKDKGCQSCLARSDCHVAGVDEEMKW